MLVFPVLFGREVNSIDGISIVKRVRVIGVEGGPLYILIYALSSCYDALQHGSVTTRVFDSKCCAPLFLTNP